MTGTAQQNDLGLRTRLVTLVLVDGDGALIGRLDPFEVPTPWWQDLLPVHERVGGIAVLRMLSADGSGGASFGGRITYLAEVLDEAELPPRSEFRTFGDSLDDHPLRMPWARPGGPGADLAWAASLVDPTGLPLQHRAWNLSAIWSIPTAEGTVWLKCVPPFFAHEAAVLGQLDGLGGLGGRCVPELIGADGHRMLLAAMGGRDGYDASVSEHLSAVDVLVELQASTAGRLGGLLDAGVPELGWPSFLAAGRDVVARRLPSDGRLERLLETAARRVERIEDCGLGAVLVHGDAHTGNARTGPGAEPPIWFDWGDSFVGHPLFDLAVLARDPGGPSGERAELVRRHWLDRFATAWPGSDPHRAWPLLEPFAVLRLAVVYQGFLDKIEPSERPFHDLDVLPALEQAAVLAAARPL